MYPKPCVLKNTGTLKASSCGMLTWAVSNKGTKVLFQPKRVVARFLVGDVKRSLCLKLGQRHLLAWRKVRNPRDSVPAPSEHPIKMQDFIAIKVPKPGNIQSKPIRSSSPKLKNERKSNWVPQSKQNILQNSMQVYAVFRESQTTDWMWPWK
jgi:hypothetical protein